MSRVEWTRYSGEDIETVIAVMLLRERPRAAHMRPSRGDGGVDVLTSRPGGPPIVDQIKSFATGALTSGRKRQIAASLARVRSEFADELDEWNLVLPMNHTREQLRWFQQLEAPFEKRWLGLSYLEGLVAKYPEVVDYYLHGGRERVADHARDLLEVGAFQLGVATGQLDATAITTALVAASGAINRSDPHYRYEFRVGAGHVDVPPNPEGWVFSQTTGLLDGTSVTIDIFARFDQAAELRPIPMSVTLLPQSAADEAAAADFFDYGSDVEIAADVQLPDGLPGGLPDPSGTGRIRIVAHQTADRPDIELRLVDDRGITVAFLPIQIVSSSQGRVGGRFKAVDRSGAVELDGRTSEAHGRASFSYSLRLDRLEGQAVRACLDVVRFSTSLREPYRLALAFAHGGVVATSEPIVGAKYAADQQALLSLLEDLSTLQELCPVPLCWDSMEAAREQNDIRECAVLLRGGTLEGTWTDFSAGMLPDARPLIEAIHEPNVLVHERDLGFELFGQNIHLGTERMVFDSVIPAIGAVRADGSLNVVFAPGGNNRYVRSLVRA